MLEIIIENSFKKDIQRDKKSGKYKKNDFELLKILIDKLANQKEIEDIYKRHSLKGNLENFEVLHIKNDWLLVFKVDENYLYLVMLGKHTQVYKKFK